ncbi:hypothetical protein TRIP_C90442 [Candidatus Zixiibacteriota bacterium]|nr:hypothetical protein TRIP_C90442 [candidate division Zixibacteria bacterium]
MSAVLTPHVGPIHEGSAKVHLRGRIDLRFRSNKDLFPGLLQIVKYPSAHAPRNDNRTISKRLYNWSMAVMMARLMVAFGLQDMHGEAVEPIFTADYRTIVCIKNDETSGPPKMGSNCLLIVGYNCDFHNLFFLFLSNMLKCSPSCLNKVAPHRGHFSSMQGILG